MNKFLKWLDNYWYHYKWHTIITAFFAVFLMVSIGQLVTKEKVDAYVLYAGEGSFFVSDLYSMEDAFEQVSDDFNDDGKKTVKITDVVVMTDEQIKENKEKAEAEGNDDYYVDMQYMSDMRDKFKMQLTAGEAYLCLLSPEMYELDYGVGMYMTLEELGISPALAYDDCAINFKQTDFGKYFTIFEKMPEDTLICFRRMNVASKTKGKKEQKKYDDQLMLFKKVLEFDAPEVLPDE